jgi:glycosyltransferase involved in cell wall biosynthesis
MMEVMFVVNSRRWGGAEQWVGTVAHSMAQHCAVAVPAASPLATRLAGSGCVIRCLSIGPKLSRRNFLEFIATAPLRYLSLRRLLARARDEDAVSTVHFQFKKEQVLGTLAARRLGLRVVWTEHGPLPRLVEATPLLPLYLYASRMVDAIITPSERAKASLASKGIASEKVQVVPHGLAATWFQQPDEDTRRAVRDELGIPADALVVAKVCSVSRCRGHDTLLAAAAQARRQNPMLRFLIVGDGPELPRVRARAQQAALADIVTFTGFRSDVQRLLAASDVFVSASAAQGEAPVPFRLVEAMASGLPVIATDTGGTAEAVMEGDTGYIVPPRDPGALSQRILELAADPALATTMGARARQVARERYGLDRMLRSVHKVLGVRRPSSLNARTGVKSNARCQ